MSRSGQTGPPGILQVVRELAGGERDNVVTPSMTRKFRALAHPGLGGAGNALPGLDADGAEGVASMCWRCGPLVPGVVWPPGR